MLTVTARVARVTRVLTARDHNRADRGGAPVVSGSAALDGLLELLEGRREDVLADLVGERPAEEEAEPHTGVDGEPIRRLRQAVSERLEPVLAGDVLDVARHVGPAHPLR